MSLWCSPRRWPTDGPRILKAGLGRRPRSSVPILLAVLALGCPVAFGGEQPVSGKTLRGLSGVGVRVERMPPEAEQAGMTRRQVQTEVEQRLREGGIRVLTPELLSAFGRPVLAVTIQLTPAEHGPRELYGVHITVALKQQVLLERNMTLPAVEAATWEVVALGAVGQEAWPRAREDVARFCQVIEAETRLRQTGAHPRSYPPFRQPVPCL